MSFFGLFGTRDLKSSLYHHYIADRILIIGKVWNAATVKDIQRNNASDLAKFLDENHKNQYLIWNLSQSDTSIFQEYNYQVLDINLSIPYLDTIFRCCYSLEYWLSSNPQNIAVLHGSPILSSLLTTCYLVFKGNFDNTDNALDYVLSAITPLISMESYPLFYRRALSDFNIVYNLPSLPNILPLRLIVLVVEGLRIPCNETIQLDILKNNRTVYSTQWNIDNNTVNFSDDTLVVSLDCLLCGNYYIIGYTGNNPESGGRKIFRYLFHSGLVVPGETTVLNSSRVDIYNRDYIESDDAFKLMLHIEEIESENNPNKNKNNNSNDNSNDKRKTNQNMMILNSTNYYLRGNKAKKEGLKEITMNHLVTPSNTYYYVLISKGYGDSETTFALQRTNNNLEQSEELLQHSKPNITSLTTIPMNKLDFNIDNYVERIQKEFPTCSQDSIEDDDYSDNSGDNDDDGCLNVINNNNNSNSNEYKPRRSLIVTPNRPSSYSIHSNDNTPNYKSKDYDNNDSEAESLSPDNNNNNSSSIKCNICGVNNVDQNQLIQCNDCRKYYHTYCEGLRQIPYNNYPNDENIKRLLYIKEYYSDWTCKSCDNKIYINSPPSPLQQQQQLKQNKPSQLLPPSTSSASEQIPFEVIIPRSKSFENIQQVFEEEIMNNKNIIPSEQQQQQQSTLQPISIPQISSSSSSLLLVPFPSKSPISSPIHTNSNTPKLSPIISGGKKILTQSKLVNKVDNSNKRSIKYIEHPVYMKYFKMLKTGIPIPAVEHCILKDGYKFNINIIIEHNPDDIVEEENDIEVNSNEDNNNNNSNSNGNENSKSKSIFLLTQLRKIENNSQRPSIELSFAVSPTIDNDNDDKENSIDEYIRQYKSGRTINEILIELYDMKYEQTAIDSLLQRLNINKQEIQFKRSIHPILKQYYKMKMVGVPIDAVNHKMMKDNVNPILLEGNENDLIDYDLSKYNNDNDKNNSNEVMLKDHPIYGKYFKMLSIGMPMQVVEHKMKMDGKENEIFILSKSGDDLYPIDINNSNKNDKDEICLKDHPIYGKYFKMLSIGMPMQVVEHKMKMDGKENEIFILSKSGDDLYPINPTNIQLSSNNNNNNSNSSASPVKKAQMRPKVRSRKIFWNEINNTNLENSLWNSNKLPDIPVDNSEIEELFTLQESSSPESSHSKTKSPDIIRLITDSRRSTNVSIKAKKLKISPSVIRDSIINLTVNNLNNNSNNNISIEQWEIIGTILPTKEEMEIMNKFGGDKSRLGETESFFIQFANIERLTQRYKCLFINIISETKMNDIQQHINEIMKGCDLLIECKEFHNILNIILEVGNKLNTISSMKEIKGFSILSLENFVNTKSFKGNITLLHYIAKLINDTKPELFKCISSLEILRNISKISIDLIYSEEKEFNENKNIVKTEYNYWEGRNADLALKLDEIYQHLQQFSDDIHNLIKCMNEKFEKMLIFFGEDVNAGIKPEIYFLQVSNFISLLNKAHNECYHVKTRITPLNSPNVP